MIACGKKEEVEVIPPYKIMVVRTCILKFLHSDPPVVQISFSLVNYVVLTYNWYNNIGSLVPLLRLCKK